VSTATAEVDHLSRAQIHPGTAMGTVRLTVSDLAASRRFYARALGLQATEQEDGTIALGAAGEHPLVELLGDASAAPLDRHATGLFHLAVLVPSRRELAMALARLGEANWPLDGASDHLVSEALYLSDPDGNGIEIYRDRPREEWRHMGDQLEMATLPLDLRNLLAELAGAEQLEPLAPPGTRMGHVHLQVSELPSSEAFYSGILGFDVTVRGYPGALFVSAACYHHHLGLNTWHSRDASPPLPGAIGLRGFEILLPNADALAQVLDRLRSAGIATKPQAAGVLVRDPSGNAILLRAA